MRELTYTAYAVDAATGLFLSLVFYWLYRSYRYRFLIHWMFAWAALFVHHVAAVGAMWAFWELGAFHPGRTAMSAVSVLAGYAQASWLILGTYEAVSGRRLSRHKVRIVAGLVVVWALASVAIKVGDNGLGASELRMFVRVGLYGLVTSLAFGVAASRVITVRRQESTGFGLPLVAVGLTCLSLQGLYTFGLNLAGVTGNLTRLPGITVYLGYIAAMFNVVMGVGTIVWFLEREQRRVSQMLEDRKRIEDERREILDKVHHAQKMESLGKVAGGIAHDFNNVLTIIASHTALLRHEELSGEAEESVREIETAAHRASTLTRQLLAFGRRQVLELESVELGQVVNGMERMLGRVLGDEIPLRVDVADDDCHVTADRTQLEQVLMNLIINARDAIAGRGRIEVSLRKMRLRSALTRGRTIVSPGRYCVLSVQDDGAGIPEEYLERIFEPFFTTKELGKGTGLGLSMVYGIVTQSGGHVVVESKLGHGTRFEIYLPRVEPSCASGSSDEMSVVAQGHERILVVDDDARVRRLVARILRVHGYAVEEASDEVEALRTLRTRHAEIELLITDVVMPDVSGPELAREFRQLRPSAAVLFMSGYTFEQLDDRSLDDASELLPKPFDPVRLARKVRSMLDAAAATEVSGSAVIPAQTA